MTDKQKQAIEKQERLEEKGNPRNYPEDDRGIWESPSGIYHNVCPVCKEEFMGHKTRVVCKICKKKLKDSE